MDDQNQVTPDIFSQFDPAESRSPSAQPGDTGIPWNPSPELQRDLDAPLAKKMADAASQNVTPDIFKQFDPSEPTTSGPGAAARSFAASAIPGLGGMVGAGAGMRLGAAAGTLIAPEFGGTFVGGLLGGLGGAWLASYGAERAQDYTLNKIAPEDWEKIKEKMLAGEGQHPIWSLAGGLSGSMIGMSPFAEAGEGATIWQKMASKTALSSRAVSGAILATIQGAQDYASGEGPSWKKEAVAFGGGVLFPGLNRIGQSLTKAGERFPEAFYHPAGKPIEERPPSLREAVASGAMATDEVYNGQEKMAPAFQAEANAQMREENLVLNPPPNPQVADRARAQEPGLFEKVDAVQERINSAKTFIETLDTPTKEKFDELTEQHAGLTEKLAATSDETEQRRLKALITTTETELNDLDAKMKTDSGSGLQEVRKHLADATAEMQDLDPLVRDAYARAGEQVGALVMPKTEAPEAAGTEAGGQPPTPAPLGKTIEEQKEYIVNDVKQRLIDAGMDPVMAETYGRVDAEHFAAMSAMYDGARGSPEEWYNRERTSYFKEEPPPPAFEPPPPPPSSPTPPGTEPLLDTVERNPPPEPEPPKSPDEMEPAERFVQAVKDKFASGERPFNTIVEARSLAKSLGLEIPEGESSNKIVDELVERAIVEHARGVVENDRAAGADEADTYAKLVKLYENQPNLSSRTSTSVAEQAYSTPVPLAYVASRLAGIDSTTKVLEPTAGNGMLLVEASPKNARVNELNKSRAETLKKQGFIPTTDDAADPETFAKNAGAMDVIVANPPFGSVREGGETKTFSAGGEYNTTQIDHAISLNSLKAMKADGKAVLIIGGVPAESADARARGYMGKAKRQFFYHLLKDYNVTDIFTVSGDLYSKQGAGFPVDVILIEGRGKSSREPLTKTPPPLLKSWEEVGERLNASKRRDPERPGLDGQGRPEGAGPSEQDRAPGSRNGVGGTATLGTKPLGGGRDRPQGQSELDGSRDSSEPGPDGGDAVVAGARNPPGEGADVRVPYPGPDTVGGGSVTPPAPAPAPEPPPAPTPPQLSPLGSNYGANNKLVTQERMAELREIFRAMLKESSSQLNAGVNPKMMQVAAEMAIFHIEAGTRSFIDFAKSFAEDIGRSLSEVMPYVRFAYNGARDMMEDQGIDVSGLDSSSKVKADFDALTESIKQQTEQKPVERPKEVEEIEGQTPYEPASRKGIKLGTLLPANLRDGTNEALSRLERLHGDVDEYVSKSLDYPSDENGMYFIDKDGNKQRPFAAEQIDAIGLCLSNIEKGEGFIIGDQTGIGKGRVVAAAISYAKKRGLLPIFVTEKPNLYGDMWRDLHDIGWDQKLNRPINMVMTNAETSVPLDDEAMDWIEEVDAAKAEGSPIPPKRGSFSNPQSSEAAERHMKNILNRLSGQETAEPLPDVVFTTYDQMNSIEGAETERRKFLRAAAPHSFLIMDEAHNAGGGDQSQTWKSDEKAPPRSELFREAVGLADSVMYSSATYAKTPTVMTLYSRTDMAKAVDSPADLPKLIERGGVPLQQVIAGMLAKAGQYLRRERSFEGVSYDQEFVPVDEKTYGDFTDGLGAIFWFDKTFENERKELADKYAKEEGAGTTRDSGVGAAASQTTAFSSIMHNIINQMIVAIKVEAAAKRAVQAIRDGEKPIITLSRTNSSFIEDFIGNAGLKLGDETDLNFSNILHRYLERTRRVTISLGNKEKKFITIPLNEMSPQMQQMYAHAEEMLKDIDLGNLPISPIDAIRKVVSEAGYKVREITGRKTMLDLSGDKMFIVKRPNSEMETAGKKMSVKLFNDGKLDNLVLNQSGSTGISLHSSIKFKDQRRRRMIIAEADPNIDTHMQMLGRVHRTGQVIPPAYTHFVADIPAEVRPTAVLMRKMASLNANTTGSTKSRFMSESLDFLNKYGDEVVAQVLNDDPEAWRDLGMPHVVNDQGKTIPGAAAKATGRLTLLSPQKQQELLDAITEKYKQAIQILNETGENDLEASYLDLRAKVLESAVIKPASGPSPFQGEARLDRVSVKSQGRAMAPDEVLEHTAKFLKTDVPTGKFADAMERLVDLGGEKQNKLIAETKKDSDAYIEFKKSLIKTDDARLSFELNAGREFDRWKEIADVAKVGSIVNINVGGGDIPAIVIGFAKKETSKSPTALSSWEVTFAVPNGQRSISIPVSRVSLGDVERGQIGLSRNDDLFHKDIEPVFEAARKEGREERYMFSGNILGAFDATNGRGQIITHTMEDGSRRPAILMGRGFKSKEFMENRAVRFENGEHVISYLDNVRDGEVKSSDGVITIIRKDWKGYEFEVPRAKASGGQYYADRKVIDTVAPNVWEKRGSKMRITVRTETAKKLVDALKSIGAAFETRENQDLATSLAPKGQEFYQGVTKGRIRFSPGDVVRSDITFMKDWDASTWIHEKGHEYLERMRRYAALDDAPEQLKKDWNTIKEWAKIRNPSDLSWLPRSKRRSEFKKYTAEKAKNPDAFHDFEHEKVATVFEQYMRKGHAPSSALESVFARIKEWMLKIYKTAANLGYPINDDIRGVFDRWISEPSKPTVVAEPRPAGPTRAEIHQTDAAHVEPPHAEGLGDLAAAEQEKGIEERDPKIRAEHEAAEAIINARRENSENASGPTKVGEHSDGYGTDASGGARGEGGGNVVGGNSENVSKSPSVEVGGESEQPGQRPGVPSVGVGDSPALPISSGSRLPEPTNPVVDKTGNIRWDNVYAINADQGFQRVIDHFVELFRDTASENEQFLANRRGVVSDKEVSAAGLVIAGSAPDRVLSKTIGEAFSAEEIKALQKLAADSSVRTFQLASQEKDAIYGSPEHIQILAQIERQKEFHRQIQAAWSQSHAEAGRALRAFRKDPEIWNKAAESADQYCQREFGKSFFQTALEARAISGFDDEAQLAKFIADSGHYTFGKMLLEYWTNGLISGVPTHVTYMVGNVLSAANKVFLETPAAATIGALRAAAGQERERIPFSAVSEGFRGATYKGFAPAVKAAAESAATGLKVRLPSEADTSRTALQSLRGGPDSMRYGASYDEHATMKTAMGAWYGVVQGLHDAIATAGSLLKAGGVKDAPLWGWEYSTRGAIPNASIKGVELPVGDILRLPGRGVGVLHSFTESLNFSIEMNIREHADAFNELSKDPEWKTLPHHERTDRLAEKIADLRANRTPEKIEEALDAIRQYAENYREERGKINQALRDLQGNDAIKAQQAAKTLEQIGITDDVDVSTLVRLAQSRAEAAQQSFMGPPGAFTQMILRVVNHEFNVPFLGKAPYLKFFDPFVNISSQIIRGAALQRTPLGILAPTIRADLMGQNGAVRQDVAMAKMVVGSAILMLFGSLAAMGLSTGASPDRRGQSNIWRTEYQPYSILIDGAWVSLHRFGSLGLLMGLGADLYDASQKASEEDLLTATMYGVHAIVQNLAEESWARGPADLAKAALMGSSTYAKELASTFLPFSSFNAYTAKSIDPYAREARTYMDFVMRKIPVASESLEPKVDVWGNYVPNNQAVGGPLTAIWEKNSPRDPVDLEMIRLKMGMGPVPKKVAGQTLTPEQYTQYATSAGKLTKYHLDQIVNSPRWSMMTDDQKIETIKMTFKKDRAAAAGRLKWAHPEIPWKATRAARPR